MRYTPEKYEFDTGDIVVASDFNEVAIRVAHDEWKTSTQRRFYDEGVAKALSNSSWKYLGNRND